MMQFQVTRSIINLKKNTGKLHEKIKNINLRRNTRKLQVTGSLTIEDIIQGSSK